MVGLFWLLFATSEPGELDRYEERNEEEGEEQQDAVQAVVLHQVQMPAVSYTVKKNCGNF